MRIALLLLLASSLIADENATDPKLQTLSLDLKTLARVVDLADDLGDTRQMTLALVDEEIDALREPRGDGTYRWASLQREEASSVSDEKHLEKVHTEAQLHTVSVTAPRAYRLVVAAPQKRNLFSANNRVYFRKAHVEWTSFDGKTTSSDIPVDVWINPGDSHGVPLPDIAQSARISAELGVESGNKKAVANVALLQAKLVDDPKSPYFPAVQRLMRVRSLLVEKDIRRGELKSAVDEAILNMPGELQKRIEEQNAEAERRRAMATSGTEKNSIHLGDATPDVVNALAEIHRLLSGNLDDQAEARTQLKALIDSLRPSSEE